MKLSRTILQILNYNFDSVTSIFWTNCLNLILKNYFIQSVSNGFFLATLFSDHLPFVELNGEKIGGTTEGIIDTLERMGMVEKSNEMMIATTEMGTVEEETEQKSDNTETEPFEKSAKQRLKAGIHKIKETRKAKRFFTVLKTVMNALANIYYFV